MREHMAHTHDIRKIHRHNLHHTHKTPQLPHRCLLTAHSHHFHCNRTDSHMDRRLETKRREYMLKTKSCYDVNFIVTGSTAMCPYGKLLLLVTEKLTSRRISVHSIIAHGICTAICCTSSCPTYIMLRVFYRIYYPCSSEFITVTS